MFVGLIAVAALFEVGGTSLVWVGLRNQRSLVAAGLGIVALGVYGVIETLQPETNFGRLFAAYGGVFATGSLLWGIAVEGSAPTGGTSPASRSSSPASRSSCSPPASECSP